MLGRAVRALPPAVTSRAAAATVTAITAVPVDTLDLTTAPGGGPSGGITYVIAYLNLISDGAFTGRLRVATTGTLASDGYACDIVNILADHVMADPNIATGGNNDTDTSDTRIR